MNNEIKPHYVDFNTAKLLKEKGFDIDCKMCVEDEGERPLPFNCGNTIHKNSLHPYYSAPEQWQVIEWLRINHDIWVEVNLPLYNDFRFTIIDVNKKLLIKLSDEFYDTPQAAYSAAFDYIKENNFI
jgi:hypothetical protein